MLRAEPLDPSFTWRGQRRERWTWRSIGLLLVIAAGTGFFVGRLSTAAPVATGQRTASEQQTAAAGSGVQSQAALQPDAPIRSTTTTDTGAKPAAKDGTKESSTASSRETPQTRPTTATAKGSASPPVVLINPSPAEKAGDAAKQPKAELEVAANAKTETQKAADDGAPAATTAKRQAKSRAPAPSGASAAPVRQDSVAVRRDDAYVPPRLPQAAYADQRERYDSAGRDQERPRFDQTYPDRRYAEDVPPPRTYSEYRREYLRPFQDSRDFREYRRFGGYDEESFADRRPVLRPMYGGGPNY